MKFKALCRDRELAQPPWQTKVVRLETSRTHVAQKAKHNTQPDSRSSQDQCQHLRTNIPLRSIRMQ